MRLLRIVLFFIACFALLLFCSCASSKMVVKPADPAENEVSGKTAKNIREKGGKITVPDPVLRVRIAETMRATKHRDIAGLKTEVYKGHVLIRGKVDTFKKRALAERSVRTLQGVKKVSSKITVARPVVPKSTFHNDRRSLGQISSDDLVEKAIRRRFAKSPHVVSSTIKVEVYESVALLSGYVRSEKEKKLANEIALFTDQVRSVVNNLDVRIVE